MKSFVTYASAAILFATAILFTGCGKSPSEMVVGTWKIEDMNMGEIPEERKAMFEEMMKQIKENSSMDIKADGTFMQTMWMNEKVESGGKWTMSEDAKSFITTSDENNKVDTLNVEELTANKFVVSASERGQKITITYSK